MSKSESNRYDPRIHGDPERFVARPLPYDYYKRTQIDLKRRSSVLTAAFTPLIKEFRDYVIEDFPPETTRHLLEQTEIISKDYPDLTSHITLIFNSGEDRNFSRFDTSRLLEACITDQWGEIHQSPLEPVIQAPVSNANYGQRFADATVKAAGALSQLAIQVMEPYSAKLYMSPYRHAIFRDTFWRAPHQTMAEGMQTTAAAISLLTAEKIPGYETDPLVGVEALVDQKVFQHFAAHLPSGVMIRMIDAGLYIPGILKGLPNGSLRLSPDSIQCFKTEKTYKQETGRGRLSQGCPVAIPHVPTVHPDGSSEIIEQSGVQMGMELFLPYLRYYYDQG